MTRRFSVPTDEVIAVAKSCRITTPNEVAQLCHCHPSTAKRHLDGGVFRGDLIMDDYDSEGHKVTIYNRRYGDAA